MLLDEFYERLWDNYINQNPQAGHIHDLLQALGEEVHNDHIAFRTFEGERLGIDVLASYFEEQGYVVAGEYDFSEKKLLARHYELEGQPRVFISELKTDQFSDTLQILINSQISQVPPIDDPAGLLLTGRPWMPITWHEYETLRAESEYAAWLSAFGYCANHFTVSVNHLNIFRDLEMLNEFLEQNHVHLNECGGKIKGSPEQLLEQSSTLAERVLLDFADGEHELPACYYEFAKRYRDDEGELFNGFIQTSADKIFESTDRQD